MQQMMQVATHPSPVKAVFTHDDIELAAVVLMQHLIASSSLDVGRPLDSTRPPQTVDEDDAEPRRNTSSDVAPPPSLPPSSSSSAADAALAASTAVANDDGIEQAAARHARRQRKFTVRPPLPAVGQLIEMGFPRRKAEAAVKQLGMPLLMLVIVL